MPFKIDKIVVGWQNRTPTCTRCLAYKPPALLESIELTGALVIDTLPSNSVI
jgi:hypothetical protein